MLHKALTLYQLTHNIDWHGDSTKIVFWISLCWPDQDLSTLWPVENSWLGSCEQLQTGRKWLCVCVGGDQVMAALSVVISAEGLDHPWKWFGLEGEGCQLLETNFLQFNRNANWLRFFFEPEVCLCGHQMPCNRSLWFLQPRVKQQWREIQLKLFAHLFLGQNRELVAGEVNWDRKWKFDEGEFVGVT